MSAPPASMSPSRPSRTSSGCSATQASGGSIRAIAPAPCNASTYARESRNASRSQTVQRARSSAVQSPIRGLRRLRSRSFIPSALPQLHRTITRRIARMTVQVQRRGGVTTLVLDRPQAMNAINPELGDELLKAINEAAEDDKTRAVVLTGNGKAFSSGADLKAGFDPDSDGFPDV